MANCYLRQCYFYTFLELSHRCHKHFYLIPGIFRSEAALAILPLVDQKGHIMSASSKPTRQLITALLQTRMFGSASAMAVWF